MSYDGTARALNRGIPCQFLKAAERKSRNIRFEKETKVLANGETTAPNRGIPCIIFL